MRDQDVDEFVSMGLSPLMRLNRPPGAPCILDSPLPIIATQVSAVLTQGAVGLLAYVIPTGKSEI